jgi:hypothetical protein
MTEGLSNNRLTSLADHLNEQYGERGIATREEFEEGFKAFELEVMLQELIKKTNKTNATDRNSTH